MRKILFLVFATMLATTLATGQTQSNASLYYAGTAVGDTLVDQDTAIYYLVRNQTGHSYLSVIFSITQVSGTNAGTISYQVANPHTSNGSATTTAWHTVSSQTLTGSGTTLWYFGRDAWERWIRIQIITPAGTRRTAVKYEGRLTRY